jgi:hypothetical protein
LQGEEKRPQMVHSKDWEKRAYGRIDRRAGRYQKTHTDNTPTGAVNPMEMLAGSRPNSVFTSPLRRGCSGTCCCDSNPRASQSHFETRPDWSSSSSSISPTRSSALGPRLPATATQTRTLFCQTPGLPHQQRCNENNSTSAHLTLVRFLDTLLPYRASVGPQ